jgi:hypothetical protein
VRNILCFGNSMWFNSCANFVKTSKFFVNLFLINFGTWGSTFGMYVLVKIPFKMYVLFLARDFHFFLSCFFSVLTDFRYIWNFMCLMLLDLLCVNFHPSKILQIRAWYNFIVLYFYVNLSLASSMFLCFLPSQNT